MFALLLLAFVPLFESAESALFPTPEEPPRLSSAELQVIKSVHRTAGTNSIRRGLPNRKPCLIIGWNCLLVESKTLISFPIGPQALLRQDRSGAFYTRNGPFSKP